MTEELAEQIEALAAKATQSPLSDGGYYFSETCNDLTSCSHGETGHYSCRADGDLVAALWNNLPAIIAALRTDQRCAELEAENARLREAVWLYIDPFDVRPEHEAIVDDVRKTLENRDD